MMVRISIIIPIYNAEKYICKSLSSALIQSLKDIEIICVDDGSHDGDYKSIYQYIIDDSRIVFIHKKNEGVSAARNNAIAIAKGEYIFFLDADDWIYDKESLIHLYTYAKKNGLNICGGSLCRSSGNTHSFSKHTTQSKYVFDEYAVVEYRKYQYDLGFTRFIYNRKFLLNSRIVFPEYVSFEDPVFMVRALNTARIFGTIPEIVYVYRENPTSSSQTINKIKCLHMLSALKDNLIYAQLNELWELYALTVRRIDIELRCEIEHTLNYLDDDRQVFDLLSAINSQIDWGKYKCERGIIYPMLMVYNEYRKYETMRQSKIIRLVSLFRR